MFIHAETLRALARGWREESTKVRTRYGSDPVAHTLKTLAQELADCVESAASRLYTLTEAAAVCGYSADHLGRLVRNGKVPNAGRPNAPRVALRDLPMKPGHLPSDAGYGEVTSARAERIARSIVNPMEGRDG